MGVYVWKRIGVLTGGGDCPGLNAVIRAVVKSAAGKNNCEVVGFEDGFDGLVLPNKTRELSSRSIREYFLLVERFRHEPQSESI